LKDLPQIAWYVLVPSISSDWYMMKRQAIPIALIPSILLVGGGLLLISAAILLGRQNATIPPTSTAPLQEDTYPEIPRVSLDEARAALEMGSATFVDVRSADSYQASHVAGAISIPLDQLEARLAELDKGEWIITYCT
jgi:hypothetical protein